VYNFAVVSSSRFRGVLGDDLYDNHWNGFLTELSQSHQVLSGSQIQQAEQWLVDCENSSSGSVWFEMILSNNGGSF
jgi:hypothetical protein